MIKARSRAFCHANAQRPSRHPSRLSPHAPRRCSRSRSGIDRLRAWSAESQPATGAIARAEQALAADPRNVQRLIELGVAQSGARQLSRSASGLTDLVISVKFVYMTAASADTRSAILQSARCDRGGA